MSSAGTPRNDAPSSDDADSAVLLAAAQLCADAVDRRVSSVDRRVSTTTRGAVRPTARLPRRPHRWPRPPD